MGTLIEDLLVNPLNTGGPINPPDGGGGLAPIRNTIKEYAGLTHNEQIAKIATLIVATGGEH